MARRPRSRERLKGGVSLEDSAVGLVAHVGRGLHEVAQPDERVMPTRCQARMVIVTQRAFLHNANTGKKTLLGTLAEHWEKRVGPADA